MDPLVLAAASAVVTAMATDAWQQARAAVVELWRRSRPEHVGAIETDLDDTRAEVVAARTAGDRAAEGGLVGDWQRKLRRLVDANPGLGIELRRVLDEELTPMLSAGERARLQNIQNITASASGATAQGAMFGNIINYRPGSEDGSPQASPRTEGENLAPSLIQNVDVLSSEATIWPGPVPASPSGGAGLLHPATVLGR
jgi:hypothetical protein